MCFSNAVFTFPMAKWVVWAGDKDIWEKDILVYEPVFYFYKPVSLYPQERLVRMEQKHRICHCQMPFWKGLALNSCTQSLGNKNQAIRLSIPGMRVFTPLLLVLMWSSSETPGWFTRAFLGKFHVIVSLFRRFLGKKKTSQYVTPLLLNPAGL